MVSIDFFSGEIKEKLSLYESFLLQWNQRINLIGPATVDDIWQRHFLDSAQLLEHIPETSRTLLDVGTGAGFPGVVLSILGVPGVVLLEKSHKRCMFLKEVCRQLNLSARVENQSIENFLTHLMRLMTSQYDS